MSILYSYILLNILYRAPRHHRMTHSHIESAGDDFHMCRLPVNRLSKFVEDIRPFET